MSWLSIQVQTVFNLNPVHGFQRFPTFFFSYFLFMPPVSSHQIRVTYISEENLTIPLPLAHYTESHTC